MSWLHRWFAARSKSTRVVSRRRRDLCLEALEDRLVPANLSMTEAAIMSGAHHNGSTMLWLNFDGGDNGLVHPFSGPSVTEQDIQEILFRTSEIYAPFNVEVSRMFGFNNMDQGDAGNTTIVVGSYNRDAKGAKTTEGHVAGDSADYPTSKSGDDHVFHSNKHNIGWVDPFQDSLPGGRETNLQISQEIAHEAGHTFGLAHVRTDGLADP
jgi:hypothetical protein